MDLYSTGIKDAGLVRTNERTKNRSHHLRECLESQYVPQVVVRNIAAVVDVEVGKYLFQDAFVDELLGVQRRGDEL